jgi:hypothetical protein
MKWVNAKRGSNCVDRVQVQPTTGMSLPTQQASATPLLSFIADTENRGDPVTSSTLNPSATFDNVLLPTYNSSPCLKTTALTRT